MEAFIALVCPLFPEIARRTYGQNENDAIVCKINTMDIFGQVAEMKWREGLQEGLEKGVRAMLANTGLSVKEIASVFGLSVALVKKLAKEVRAK